MIDQADPRQKQPAYGDWNRRSRSMNHSRELTDVLNRDFLETRCKILEVAAALDRLDRAPGRTGEHHPDRRLAQLRQAIEALLEPGPGRAETVQRLFSLEYDSHWRETYRLPRPRAN
jgi:hypothetical protein